MLQRILTLALSLGSLTTLHAQTLPGLPIAPVQAATQAELDAAIADPAASDELSLEALDQLIAAERQRLAEVAGAAHGNSKPVAAMPIPELPPAELDAALGKTLSMGLGLQQVSRIQTPFAELRIQHQSTAAIKKQGSVVYVSPADSTPFVIYLEDRNDPDRSIGLLLRPHATLPPVQVRLNLPGQTEAIPMAPTSTNVPGHLARIRTVLRTLVLGATPGGFSQAQASAQDPPIDCRIPGLRLSVNSAWHSSDLTVLKARADNVSAGVLSIDESACASPQVLAVAAYPDTELWPEEGTDLLVVFRAGAEMSPVELADDD